MHWAHRSLVLEARILLWHDCRWFRPGGRLIEAPRGWNCQWPVNASEICQVETNIPLGLWRFFFGWLHLPASRNWCLPELQDFRISYLGCSDSWILSSSWACNSTARTASFTWAGFTCVYGALCKPASSHSETPYGVLIDVAFAASMKCSEIMFITPACVGHYRFIERKGQCSDLVPIFSVI